MTDKQGARMTDKQGARMTDKQGARMTDKPMMGVVHPDRAPRTSSEERRLAELRLEVDVHKRHLKRIAELEARLQLVREVVDETRRTHHFVGDCAVRDLLTALENALAGRLPL